MFVIEYSRQEALSGGVLTDISTLAKEAGIKFPVAITDSVLSMIKNKPQHEEEEGRTWDVVWMLRCAIKGEIPVEKIGEDTLLFELIMNDSLLSEGDEPKMVTLKSVVGPGDNMEPVITVMLPSED